MSVIAFFFLLLLTSVIDSELNFNVGAITTLNVERITYSLYSVQKKNKKTES
jgi:hypothetical protein